MAVIVAGATPATVAVSELAPAAPRVQPPTRATPCASETALAPVTVPPPVATANVTVTPGSGWPAAVRTTTAGATSTAVPAMASWPSPSVTTTADGAPCESTPYVLKLLMGALTRLATTSTLPPGMSCQPPPTAL